MRRATGDLRIQELAKAIAQWAAGAPLTVSIFVFGIRLHGDHRPDGHVDLSIASGGSSDEIAAWQSAQRPRTLVRWGARIRTWEWRNQNPTDSLFQWSILKFWAASPI